MAGKAHGGCLSVVCFVLACVGCGQVGLTQLRIKTTASSHPQQSARPAHQSQNPSFPRRRESTAALLMTMDCRPAPLRGKLGQVDLSRAFLRGAALWAVGCQGKGIRQKTVARLLAVLAQWRGRVRAVASSSGSWRGRAGVVCG